MPNYRSASEIPWDGPVTIQMGTTGTQFSNTVQADTQLVFENGIWKYPRIAGNAGAIQLPVSTGTRRVVPVRMAAWNIQFGASAGYTIGIFGNPNNTTDDPYPAADAALYAEGDFIIGTGTATTRLSNAYGFYGDTAIAPIIMPGQRFYIITTGASNPTARFTFVPLYNSPGGL